MSVRLVLAIPVLGLVAGAAAGVRWPDIPVAWLVAALVGWVSLVLHAARVSRAELLAISACGAFLVGGWMLASDAWHRAWRPSLRILFDVVAHDARIEAHRAGRSVPEDPEAALELVGVLRSDAALIESGAASLAMDVEWAGRTGSSLRGDAAVNPVEGGVLLTVLGSFAGERVPEWRAGRRIRAPAELRRVARYLDPGVPDAERALARRGITLVGTVKSAQLIDIVSRGSRAQEAAAGVRAFTRRALARSIAPWSPRASAIVTAIVIGDRTGLDDQVERRLQEAGTYHVIAISGGNIAILAGLTLIVFRAIGMLGRTAMLSAAAGLVAYGFVVGGGASVNRAVLMAVVYFAGRAWDLRGPPLQAITLVAGILVLANPLSVVDPASLLTFGATGAIVSIAPLVPVRSLPTGVSAAAGLLVASAATEAMVLPVSATLFSRITFAGLVLNFAAIPLMAVAQLAGMAVVPIFMLSAPLARAVGWVAYVGAEGLVRTADLVAYAPWLTWRVAAAGPVAVASYYASLVATWVLWRRRARLAALLESPQMTRLRWVTSSLVVCIGLWIVAPPGLAWAAHGDGQLHVTFIDVGQGDAALVRLPGGASFLIDAGGIASGAFDIGDRVVGPVLRTMGVGRLDTVVLTHGDADHIGGAPTVLREFRPWDVWDGIPVPPHEALRTLQADARTLGARWTTVQRADVSVLDDVRVMVKHPEVSDWERQDVRNDDSVVLELRWRDVSFVFTGDIGRETEAQIAGSFAPAPLRVLKVPHHGSNTSSSDPFVRALAPDVAVISVGRSNNFGHPSPLVLQSYDAAKAAVFRTDQDGAVEIDTDGESLTVRSFVGRTLQLHVPQHSRGHEGREATDINRGRLQSRRP